MKNVFVLLALSATLLSSCVNLKHVAKFSDVSAKTVSSNAAIDFNNYKSLTKFGALSPLSAFNKKVGVDGITFYDIPKLDVSSDSAKISRALKADAGISTFVKGINIYINALGKISKGELTETNYSKVTEALKKENGEDKKLKISNEDIDALTAVAQAGTNLALSAYRASVLKKTIIQYDSSLSVAIGALTFMMENLSSIIDNSRESVTAQCGERLNDTTYKIDDAFRLKLVEEHNEKISYLNSQQKIIKEYIKGLKEVRSKHNELKKNLTEKKITTQDIIELVNEHSASIESIYTNIKLLIKNN